MKNILMLTIANVRKNKSQSVSLFIFVLIAATLLNIGLVIFTGINSFFDERAEQVRAAHLTAIYFSQTDSVAQGLRYMEDYPGVTETEMLEVVGGYGDYYMNGIKSSCFLMLSPDSGEQKLDAPSLVGDHLPLTGGAIYVPYFIMLSGGYDIGDDFRVFLSGAELNFTVAGGTEEIMFGSQTNPVYRFYISDERFEEIAGALPENGIILLSARLENSVDDVFFQADYNREVSTEGLSFAYGYSDAKQSRTVIPVIASIVITAFAIILLAVSLIVIRFRIVNSIEENMTNIGAQKAIGYRSVQIITSIVTQFAGIAIIGGIAGILLSQMLIPVIAKALEPMTALVWNPGFVVGTALIALLSVLLTISIISFLSARRISKLHPLIALRGGLATHSFKRNPLPLEKSRAPLGLVFAIKQLLQKKKQAAAICVIVAAVTMSTVAGIAVNYNMGDGREGFARALFGEMPDANFMLKDNVDGEAFKERLLARPEVRKSFGYETSVTLLVDGINIQASVVEDCSLLESNMIIDGRYPRHNNEIAIGPSTSRVAEKGIGDTVMVKTGESEKEYIVTGIVQFFQNGGFIGMITGGGISEIRPDYRFAGYNVYLWDGASVKTLIESVQTAEGNVFDSVIDMQDNLESLMNSMSGIFTAVAAGILAVTIFVVILVLYMVIKTTILHRKRELGIQKAVGFTTFQLMNQIALNMTPVILAGVVAGAFAGYFGLNPMMVAIMGGMGIVRVNLPVPLDQTIIVCIALVAISYLVSMLIARRIRKISAYALVVSE